MIKEKVRKLLAELPEGVLLVGAAKTRSPDEILQALDGGLTIIGENYVQEAEDAYKEIGSEAKWHMIGHLQSNKVKKAVKLFDMIETVDSLKLADTIDKQCAKIGKIMEILIEINSGEEPQKAGVMPSEAPRLIREISGLENVKVMGLMTMGPLTGEVEEIRPCFKRTKALFEEMKNVEHPRVQMRFLSMGMSDSYRVAIEEGANLIRIGTMIFGKRIRD
jgi:PLP dependent protein